MQSSNPQIRCRSSRAGTSRKAPGSDPLIQVEPCRLGGDGEVSRAAGSQVPRPPGEKRGAPHVCEEQLVEPARQVRCAAAVLRLQIFSLRGLA